MFTGNISGILALAMKNITWRHIGIFVLFALLAFILDRSLKEYLLVGLQEKQYIIPNFFAVTVQINEGIAFSIKLPYFIQVFLTPILLFVGMKFATDYLQVNKKFVLTILGLIVGGALSNYVDRLIYGGVIDYLAFWKYPVFNLADSFIVVGVFILVLFYGKIKRV